MGKEPTTVPVVAGHGGTHCLRTTLRTALRTALRTTPSTTRTTLRAPPSATNSKPSPCASFC